MEGSPKGSLPFHDKECCLSSRPRAVLLGGRAVYLLAITITITITILSPDQLACAPQALGETGRVVYLSTNQGCF